MSFMLLGILNAQASGGAAGAFDLLETTTLTSSASSVTFSGLDAYSDYKHLQIRGTTRNTIANSSNSRNLLNFNSDTTSSYSNHWLNGTGGSVVSGANTSDTRIELEELTPGNSNTAGIFGAFVMDILDFSSTNKYKTVRTFNGSLGGELDVVLQSGLWQKTDAITSLTLTGTNYNTGSRFSLYGIKGA